MTLADLGILYALGGAASAVIVYRQGPRRDRRSVGRAFLAIPLWPLWLPVVLAQPGDQPLVSRTKRTGTEAALLESHEAVRGTPLEPLLPREAVERIVGELRRAAERREELCLLLDKPSFGLESARARVERLERKGASARALASGRLHLENVQRLDALRRRDEQALEELAELVSTLRTQLVLARFAGEAPQGTGDVVNEVWAWVEVLGTAVDAEAPLLDTR